MKQLPKISLFLCCLFGLHLFSQTKQLDSLWSVYNNKSRSDTDRLKAIDAIAWSYKSNNPDTAIVLAEQQLAFAKSTRQKKFEGKSYTTIGTSSENKGDYARAHKNYLQALKIFEEINNIWGIGVCYNNIGRLYTSESNYPLALEYGEKALKAFEKIGDKKRIGVCYNTIGNVYLYESNYPEALANFLKSLKFAEEANDKASMGYCYNNLGNVYSEQNNYSKALEYYTKSLNLRMQIGDKVTLGVSYDNIGSTYRGLNNYEKALENHFKALKIREEIGDANGLGVSYMNIGNTYKEESNDSRALEYYLKGLKLLEEVNDRYAIGISYVNISLLYNKQTNYKLAILYCDSALKISKEIGDISVERYAREGLAEAYAKTGNYKDAYENYMKFKQLTDSIFNENNSKLLGDLKTKFEVEKKETELKIKAEAQQSIAAEEKKRQQVITYSVAGLLLIVMAFALFVFNRFKLTQKQKNIIEKQKHLVEEHQKEIIDSITYAKRLQQAILPSSEEIRKYLPDNFLLYKPKDIVAGDFYWMEHLDNTVYIAAADSTGHGVPGAMVSVVCSNALNRSVNEFGAKTTGSILDKTRELVLETFAKSGEEIKDGMDISLLSINRSSGQISWSGANNQLWYISGNKVIEIKPDKQPIGKTDNSGPFTTHSIEFKSGDIFYLMTDGYADQFGGPKGKKFKYKQLEERLLSASTKPLAEQKIILEKTFNDWKGNLEQVDDVTIIGIKV